MDGQLGGRTTQTSGRVGVPTPRIDARERVLGVTRFAGDLTVAGLLHGRLVPALATHARIRRIDPTAALAVPGVVAVLTAADLPIVGTGDARRHEPLARAEVAFAGQPVALVVATSEAAAEDGAQLVDVDLEWLPAVVDAQEAIREGASEARLGTGTNIFDQSERTWGEVASAFAGAAAVVSGRFRTSWVHQGYLEPHAALAWIEPDGRLAVACSTQATFYTRRELAELYGLRPADVRVVAAPVGGAFGAKQVLLEPLVAGAALALRRPVRVVMTRVEDFAATNPASGIDLDVRLAADVDGRFLGLDASTLIDGGAYTENAWSNFGEWGLTGAYRWPAGAIRSIGVRTDRFGTGNYRAPTGPQASFALETLIDELAERLGIDPIEMRLRNLVETGAPDLDDAPWPELGARACLEAAREHPLWGTRDRVGPGEGIGLAFGVWPGTREPAAAWCRLEPDGTLAVVTGVADISGATTSLAIIAAETFGLPLDAVRIVIADTDTAPTTPFSAGSAITYGVGPAVQQAVAQARDRLLAVASEMFEIAAADLEIVDGVVRPRGAPERGEPVAAVAARATESFGGEHAPVEGHASVTHTAMAPSAAVQLVRVGVDTETGEIRLLDAALIQDAGRAIDPLLVEGQAHGGMVQSLGRALVEALVHDDSGALLTGSFLDYALPRASMVPPMTVEIVEVPAPEGPFGARGVGESSVLGGPAAVANAVAAATGVRLRDLPMTPPRMWAAARAAARPSDRDHEHG